MSELLLNSLTALLISVGVFISFWFIISLVKKVLLKVAEKTKNNIDEKLIEVSSAPLRVLNIGLSISVGLLFVSLEPNVQDIVDLVLKSIFILSLFSYLYKIIEPFKPLILESMGKVSEDLKVEISSLFLKSLKFLVIAIGATTILQVWGYNINGFIASLGLVGMAFALAAKDTAANLFGSLVVLIDKPFKVGDWIKTPAVEGTVEEIGMRSSKVRTFTQALVTVPNAILANSAILNWSKMKKRRIKMTLALTYGTTSSQLTKILKEIKEMLDNHEDINQDSKHIYFTELADSSLGIFCYYFTNTTDWGEYMKVKEDTLFKIMEIIEINKADFAFPTQTIQLESNKEMD